MSKAKKLRKWTDVYPQGTQEGDEEQKVFIALGRHPKYEWRSVPALAKEADLTKERVEEIIQKYNAKGMIINNPKNEDQWAYWERVPELIAGDDVSIAKSDQNERIDKVLPNAVNLKQNGKMSDDGLDAASNAILLPEIDCMKQCVKQPNSIPDEGPGFIWLKMPPRANARDIDLSGYNVSSKVMQRYAKKSKDLDKMYTYLDLGECNAATADIKIAQAMNTLQDAADRQLVFGFIHNTTDIAKNIIQLPPNSTKDHIWITYPASTSDGNKISSTKPADQIELKK